MMEMFGLPLILCAFYIIAGFGINLHRITGLDKGGDSYNKAVFKRGILKLCGGR